jgi:hypothetical protein
MIIVLQHIIIAGYQPTMRGRSTDGVVRGLLYYYFHDIYDLHGLFTNPIARKGVSTRIGSGAYCIYSTSNTARVHNDNGYSICDFFADMGGPARRAVVLRHGTLCEAKWPSAGR